MFSKKAIENIDFGVPFKQNNHTFVRCTYCGIGILVDKGNGYVNAAKMVLEHGSEQKRKNLTHYLNGSDWRELTAVYQQKIGEDVQLVTSCNQKDGYNNLTKGTYIHPNLVVHLAMCVDKEFAVKVQQIMDGVNKFVHHQVKSEGLVDNPQNTTVAFDRFIENWEHATRLMYDICSEVEQVLDPSDAYMMWQHFKNVNDVFEKTTGKETGLLKDEEKKKDVEDDDEEEI
jgi:hypothetical protein